MQVFRPDTRSQQKQVDDLMDEAQDAALIEERIADDDDQLRARLDKLKGD